MTVASRHPRRRQEAAHRRAPLVLVWLLACLPWVSFQLWRCLADLETHDWISLAMRVRRLHRLGFRTRTTRYWLATAYARLEQWQAALDEFEGITRPLDDPDEATRYCLHVWSLFKLGRVGEARELLRHAVHDGWPRHRRAWAGSFLAEARDRSGARGPDAANSQLH